MLMEMLTWLSNTWLIELQSFLQGKRILEYDVLSMTVEEHVNVLSVLRQIELLLAGSRMHAHIILKFLYFIKWLAYICLCGVSCFTIFHVINALFMASTILASRKLSWCPLLPYQERCYVRICCHCFLFHLHLHQHLYLWQFPCQYHTMRYIFINAWGIFFSCFPLNFLIRHAIKCIIFINAWRMRDFSIPSKSQFVKRNWSHIFCAIYLIGCLDFNFFFPSLGCFSSCFI